MASPLQCSPPPWSSPCGPHSVRPGSLPANLAALALGLVLFSGCMVGPDYRQPEMDTPKAWQALASSRASLRSTDERDLSRWWQTFRDPTLNRLTREALASNKDLKIALARVEEARAGRRLEKSQLFPQFFANAAASRFDNPFPGLRPDVKYNIFQLGFDAIWEIDAFGQMRRQLEAASANLELAGEQYRQALVTLTADVARAYVEYRSLERQRAITVSNLETQQHTLELTETLFREGIGTRNDVVRAEAEVETTRAQLPALEAQQIALQHELEVLLGKQPGELRDWLQQPAPVPVVERPPILTAPARVIRHRPDIRAAERNLAANSALHAAAVAELYPKVSLPAFIGVRGTELATLFRQSALSYSIGSYGAQTANTLLVPLLNFGRIRAQIDQAKAREWQAYLDYEKTVLEALKEIETAFTRYLKEEIRRQSLAESVANLRQAVDLSRLRYEEGVASFLEVLDAQRSLYLTEIQLARSEAEVTTDLIAVYKALGGGWDGNSLPAAMSKAVEMKQGN